MRVESHPTNRTRREHTPIMSAQAVVNSASDPGKSNLAATTPNADHCKVYDLALHPGTWLIPELGETQLRAGAAWALR